MPLHRDIELIRRFYRVFGTGRESLGVALGCFMEIQVIGLWSAIFLGLTLATFALANAGGEGRPMTDLVNAV